MSLHHRDSEATDGLARPFLPYPRRKPAPTGRSRYCALRLRCAGESMLPPPVSASDFEFAPRKS